MGSGQIHAPAALPPVSIGQEAGCAPESAWIKSRIFLTLPGLDLAQSLLQVLIVVPQYL
jgi:hypothetical protein